MKLLRDHNGHVALLAKQGRTYLHLVTISASGLEATKITEDQLAGDWYPLDYPVEQAVDRFIGIARDRGATETARRLVYAAEQELMFG